MFDRNCCPTTLKDIEESFDVVFEVEARVFYTLSDARLGCEMDDAVKTAIFDKVDDPLF